MEAGTRQPDGDLSERLDASHVYWRSEGQDGAPLVAPNADLRDLDLAERVLVAAQLQGADLRGARLDHSLVVRAALDGAKLDGASLFKLDATRASCVGASFVEVHARLSVWIRADLTRASLVGADLVDSRFYRAEMIDSDLSSAGLQRADLSGALLDGARFVDADVADVNVERAVVSRGAFDAARGADRLIGESIPLPTASTQSSVTGPESRRGQQLERRVEAELQRSDWRHERTPLGQGTPDFLVALPGERHAALEVKYRPSQDYFHAVAGHVDAVVSNDVALASEDPSLPRVLRVEEVVDWLNRHAADTQPLTGGALTAAMREVARLRPYWALARQSRIDPSFVSRLSTWLDTGRDPVLLAAADRPLAEVLPAHLDGEGLARSVRWAEQRIDELADYDQQVRKLWKAHRPLAERAHKLAVKGKNLEEQLAATARG